MVLVDLEGQAVEGKLRPSSDTPTHAELYRGFPHIGGVVHTHSFYATAFAQAGRPIPVLGTTHADFFFGAVPVTRPLTRAAIAGELRGQDGQGDPQAVREAQPREIPGVLVLHHGPFTWGAHGRRGGGERGGGRALRALAYHTLALGPVGAGIIAGLVDRHFRRKHGPERLLRAGIGGR
jgi:L-ribulose-5-phosphate 4-epimerase